MPSCPSFDQFLSIANPQLSPSSTNIPPPCSTPSISLSPPLNPNFTPSTFGSSPSTGSHITPTPPSPTSAPTNPTSPPTSPHSHGTPPPSISVPTQSPSSPRPTRTRKPNSKYFNSSFVNQTTLHPIPTPFEPTTHNQASKDPLWRKAMDEEYNALLRNQTWELVSPTSHSPIGCK